MTLDAGIHTISADQYHADQVADQPTLSASVANILLTQSPAHAQAAHPRLNPNFVPETDSKYDVGTCAHSLLLEGADVAEVLAFPDWRTNAAKEARDLARSHGRVPLLSKDAHVVEQMVAAVHEQLAGMTIDPPLLSGGKPEQTLVWEEAGVLCRSRVDWLLDNYRGLTDLKTTTRSAHPEAFSRNLYGLGYDVKAAFYIRGVKAVTGVTPEFRWLVVETSVPYALSVVAPGPDVLALADAKVDRALALWRNCLATDTWPAYPRRVCFAELPAWEEARFLAREDVAA